MCKRTLAAAAATVCLFGCSTPQQRAQQQQADMDKLIAEYGPSCSQAGYVRDTDPWRSCIVPLGARHDAGGGGFFTSIFGSWGRWGGGSGAGAGAGITVGR